MRVLIDADGCPVVRETVRQCAAFHVPCLLFCDTAHVFSIPGVEVFVADCGHDSTDYLLLSHLRPGDVVITQDYGLAALCLARSAQALHPAGHAYTKDNIDALLTVRAESACAAAVSACTVRLPGSPRRTTPFPSCSAAFCRKIPGLDESPKMWDNNKTTMIRLSDVRFPVPSCGRRSYL